ncbi:hypothetical protein CYLTODRAFT_422316 [Cylindrobasidium torrendii FP15055 ss-10]|uniref:DNA-directed RNA polymerase III subunit RPC3 n=1 Tax=Cylindrobasidium torrendii FP15055 ss-10 TaxID=1314674 RepID=A0A0D7BBR6_9AGAR|nr:hypothetical protein CYLTODRAFT_422316 [Cylindrobasidium torrendii FP15055 ss-10]
MADAHTARLCVQIIDSHFGSLTSTVASTLLTRGRLTLPHLIRYSGLKPRTVRACILVLVQHNLLWHATLDREEEALEINVEECLTRLRYGRYAWIAEENLGVKAREILELVLDHGKLRPEEIMREIKETHFVSDVKDYNKALTQLVKLRYLKPATALGHQSPRDKLIKYEAAERAKISGLPTTKQLREAKEVAYAMWKREEAAAESEGLTVKGRVNETAYFRINAERFNIHIRNTLIERAARQRYNEGAAAVVRAALKVTEQQQLSLAEARTEPITIANIAGQLTANDNLASGLVLTSSKQANRAQCIKEYLGILSNADNPTLTARAAAFVSFDSQKVHVEFETVGKRMKRGVLEAVVRERHGTEGVRIIRLLLETGKMDEKQISKVAMMATKDVRPKLSALAGESIISTSEVPRGADRNPTRTFYLWYIDLNKAYQVILLQLYKTLYNIGVRRQTEKEEQMVKTVLEKRARKDVQADLSLLSALDRDVLEAWEQKEERLTVLEMRVEESVFLLRDLAVLGSDNND